MSFHQTSTLSYVLFSILWLHSCASQHRSGSAPPTLQEGAGIPIVADTNLSLPPVQTRPLLAPQSLQVPQLTLSPYSVCQGQDAVLMNVQTNDQADALQVNLCSASGDCSASSFLDPSYLVGVPTAGVYNLSVRACLDPNHTTDTNNLCSPWSATQSYKFKQDNPGAVKALQEHSQLRNDMYAVCQNLRKTMSNYLASNPDRTNPVTIIVENHLNMVGLDACTELLLSPELALLEDIQQNQNASNNTAPALSSSASKSLESRQTALTVGLVFLTLGTAGTVASGLKIYLSMKNTVTQKSKDLAIQILTLQKKANLFKVKEYELEIAEIQQLQKELDNPVISEENAFDPTSMNDRVQAGLDRVVSSWSKSKIDIAGQLQPFIDKNDPEGLWNKITELHTQLNTGLKWYNFGYEDPGPKPGTAAQAVEQAAFEMHQGYEPSSFQALYELVDHRATVNEVLQKVKACLGPDCKLVNKADVIASLNARVNMLVEKKSGIEVTWKRYVVDLATSAFHAGYEGAKVGAFVGGVGAALVGKLMSPLGWVSLKDVGKGAVYGGGVGGAAGAVKGFIDKYQELKTPIFTSEEQEIMAQNNKGAAQEKISSLEDDIRAKQAEASVEGRSPSTIKEKLSAALPWIGTMLISTVATTVGSQQIAVASENLVDNPQDDFISAFNVLYDQGQVIRQKYQDNLNQLLTGSCQ